MESTKHYHTSVVKLWAQPQQLHDTLTWAFPGSRLQTLVTGPWPPWHRGWWLGMSVDEEAVWNNRRSSESDKLRSEICLYQGGLRKWVKLPCPSLSFSHGDMGVWLCLPCEIICVINLSECLWLGMCYQPCSAIGICYTCGMLSLIFHLCLSYKWSSPPGIRQF